MLAIGFAVAFAVGALVLRVLRRSYERKRTSDLMIAADAVVLAFASLLSAEFAAKQLAWGFVGVAAFAAYLAVTRLGFRILRAGRVAAGDNRRLLLLRVFALGAREEELLRMLQTHWRHAGSIQLIAGPDVATTTLEPHEFLDYVTGRLDRRFVNDAAALRDQIEHLDLERDADGRFRVNDFFCREHTWRATFRALARRSDVVLMDLRGFTPLQKGCAFEIEALMGTVPSPRVLFLVDESTDHPFLRRTFEEALARLAADAPNRGLDASGLRLAGMRGQGIDDLAALLKQLMDAASQPAGEGSAGRQPVTA
jgi:hypothetical protein